MNAMTWQYLATGVLWAIYAGKMQRVLYGDSTRLWQYCVLTALNVVIWPVGMVLASVLCPFVRHADGGPHYVNTQSCRHLRKSG